MDQDEINEIAKKVKDRYENHCEEILTKDEMDIIDYKGIYDLAKFFGNDLEFSFKLQGFYYEKRERSSTQMLEEIDSHIKDFEIKYGGDFQSVFGHISGRVEADGERFALDYCDWLDYIEERDFLVEKLRDN